MRLQSGLLGELDEPAHVHTHHSGANSGSDGCADSEPHDGAYGRADHRTYSRANTAPVS